MWAVGIDIGSKTIKCVALDEREELKWSSCVTHQGHVRPVLRDVVEELGGVVDACCDGQLALAFTGSGATGLALELGIPFVQEVVAARLGVERLHPGADAFFDLGGEDAKLVYLTPPVEQRMNTSCAGGTGSFLEDVAALLGVTMEGLDALAAAGHPSYPIASRCAVFATRDLKSLLSVGAKEDIAASAFQAVVDQTLATLACGRPIDGTTLFLGGPMEHLPALVERFRVTLGLTKQQAVKPQHAQLMPATGAALRARRLEEWGDAKSLLSRVAEYAASAPVSSKRDVLPPLRVAEALVGEGAGELRDSLGRVELPDAVEPFYIGLDAGSTTLKLAAVDAEGRLAYAAYEPAPADMRGSASSLMDEFHAACIAERGGVPQVARTLACGYGERMLVEDVGADDVLAETAAHLAGALAMYPQASFVLDIGGQDMKALWVKGGELNRTVVNETCSSGCGAFMSSTAASLGMTLAELDAAALSAAAPIDLGARCTVFMRSRVRNAQEQGADITDIAAGAAYAVAANALRRLIGPKRLNSLGEFIVVQGGAFASDAVLAAFSQELGRPVHRSEQAPLVGAIGAALVAREQARCGAFSERVEQAPNVVAFQQKLLASYSTVDAVGPRGDVRVGFVPAMNAYEALPFWHTALRELGFSILVPQPGQADDIPQASISETLLSDSVCLPAQLANRMCLQLARAGASVIVSPGYERAFHCAVSTEYSAILPDSMAASFDTPPVLVPNVLTYAPKRIMRNDDAKQALIEFLCELSPDAAPVGWDECIAALDRAYEEQKRFVSKVEEAGRAAMEWVHGSSERHGIIVCGRSYHTSPELLNDLDVLLSEQGFAVIAPLSVGSQAHAARKPMVDKSHNQNMEAVWRAAKHFLGYAALAVSDDQLDLVCLQSFGCGMDAVSLVDVERLLEDRGKPFTLIKLDSKADVSHTRIRIRALADAIRARKRAGVKAESLDACGLLGGVSKPQGLVAETALEYAEVLPFEGISSDDVEYAMRNLPADVCGTAVLLAAYSIRRGAMHPGKAIELPACCDLCLTEAVQHLMIVEGVVNPVRWSDSPRVLEYSAMREGAGRVGIAANALLLTDEQANQGLRGFASQQGVELVLPDESTWFSDEEHFVPQLESLYSQGVRHVIWLQSFCCLKAHVHARGALPALRRRFPGMVITVIDVDPQASPLNARNRLLMALEK